MYIEYKTIFMEKKVVRSTIYNGACLPGLSLFRVSHIRLWWPLSHHWSLIRSHPIHRRKGRMCIVSLFNGAEATCPDLR